MLSGMPVDVVGIVGIILLIGIVEKNGTMLADVAVEDRRERASGAPGAGRLIPVT